MTSEPELPLADMGPLPAARIGTRFDDIVITVQRDFVRRDLGERLHHVFLVSDGDKLIPCRGPGFCRECNREGGR